MSRRVRVRRHARRNASGGVSVVSEHARSVAALGRADKLLSDAQFLLGSVTSVDNKEHASKTYKKAAHAWTQVEAARRELQR